MVVLHSYLRGISLRAGPVEVVGLPASRRDFIGFGAAALAVAVAEGQRPARAEVEGDQSLLESLIKAGKPIPARAAPYVIERPIMLPGGSRVVLERGSQFLYRGTELGTRNNPTGIFVVGGDDVLVQGAVGTAVRSETPTPFLYAVMARGVTGLRVIDISTVDCHQIYVSHAVLPPKSAFSAIVTSGAAANVSRNVEVVRGGTRFTQKSAAESHGSCFIGYTFGWKVVGGNYANVSHAVQWWGGNASLIADGALANERKCGDGEVIGVTCENVIGGCWGAMGRNIRVVDCVGDGASDVMFDNEGGQDVTFLRCTARNARHGCFTTFFLCRGTKFIDCRAYQPGGAPVFRIYNSSLSTANRDVVINGGYFEGTDAIATFDTARGPVRSITVIGAVFRNVRIDLAANNNHQIVVQDNRFSFDRAGQLAFSAIKTAGTNRDGDLQASVLISGNTITSNVPQPDGSSGILVEQADYNGSPASSILRNRVSGFDMDIIGRWTGRNRGTRAVFTVNDNVTARGKVVIDDSKAAARAVSAMARNRSGQ